MTRLRLGVVGAGAWGRNHVRTAAKLADAELAAVCDTSDETRQRLAKQYPATFVTADLGELLPKVDAVIIAAPASTHADLAHRCIQAGKPCLVEKPFALNTRDAETVAKAAADRKVPVLVEPAAPGRPAEPRSAATSPRGGPEVAR